MRCLVSLFCGWVGGWVKVKGQEVQRRKKKEACQCHDEAGAKDYKMQGPGEPSITTSSSASSSHYPTSPRSASSYGPASSSASSSSSSSSASSKRSSTGSSSKGAVTYGSSTLLPPSVLPPEYLRDMRETIRQRLGSHAGGPGN